MLGYEGGDLLLTVAAWPTVGSLLTAQACVCRLWRAALVSDESTGLRRTQKCAIQIDGLTLP